MLDQTSLFNTLDERQNTRLLRLEFPHQDSPSKFLINTFDGSEGLSRCYEYKLELLSDHANVELKEMQGKLLAVHMVRADGSLRYFTGYVFSFGLKKVDGAIAYYEVIMGPWLQFLSLRKDNFLFHNTTLYEQSESIFEDYSGLAVWDWQVGKSLKTMTDACQFDETDLNYLQRRWNAAGLVYWFEHSPSGHKLVVSDDTTKALPLEQSRDVPYQRHGGSVEEDGLGDWSPVRHVAQSAFVVTSYDFKNGKPVMRSMPTVNTQGKVPLIESYEYTGALGFEDGVSGDALARLRMEEIEAAGKQFRGAGNNRSMEPGRWFHLTGHFDVVADDPEASSFLVIEVSHRATNNYQVQSAEKSHYTNVVTCLRKKIPWRPGRFYNCSDTRIYGIQTAIITGPPGEEIHTDEFGRVRVQFHWDRVGTRDEFSSAWIRVATPWSGSNFGMTSIPRVGTEVIVSFIGGDPDRPLITGMVPNVDTLPAWSLPANKTQSGMMSRSSPGGATENANALRFEDKKGVEQVWLKAERNMDTEVRNDQSLSVGGSRNTSIGVDEANSIAKNLSQYVGGNHSHRVRNSQQETIKVDALEQVGRDKNLLVGGVYKVEAGDGFEITCGEAKFYMDKSGNVAITGKSINITSDGPIQINGKPVDLNSSGGSAAVIPSPRGGPAIKADVDAQFPGEK